jgi:acetyltransferase
VALKILSPDISHKSDVGGVRLNLPDDAALREAVATMLDAVRTKQPQARLTGFTVQGMAQRPLAHELIVGASVDPTFGPVLLFGHGGTAVEVLADRAIALPPLNRVLARDLVSRTRISKLLAGYRDRPAVDLDAVCDVLIALAQMLADLPELVELDINPLWADAAGVIALDARLRVSSPGRPKSEFLSAQHEGASADRTPGAGTARFAIQPYPAQLAETVAWRGGELLMRPIRPEDEARHRAFVERCAPGDLRLRFFNVRRELPRSELARLVQIDYAREMAFIALVPGADGAPETVGVARAVADPDNVEAEFAVLVRSDLKGHGLGHLLLGKLLRYLDAHGTQRVIGDVLHENHAMRQLATSHGFELDPDGPDDSSLRYVLTLRPGPVDDPA